MENFTLKSYNTWLNSQHRNPVWSLYDSLFIKKKGVYVAAVCLQGLPHEETEYYLSVDTPIKEEKEFLTFYLDYLVSLDAFRFVEMSWEREDVIKIKFDSTKVTYDYLAVLNSLLRNCHSYWHVPFLFYKYSSWELNVDPLKLLVLSHYAPLSQGPFSGGNFYGVSPGVNASIKINGSGHSVFYADLIFYLCDPAVKLVNGFDFLNESGTKFASARKMAMNGYRYFIDDKRELKTNYNKYSFFYKEEYLKPFTKEDVKRILHV